MTRLHMRPLLLAALCTTAAAGSCAAGSPTWCYFGTSTGVDFNETFLAPLAGLPYGPSANPAFVPATSGNCSCVSYLSGGVTTYAAVGPAELATIQGNEGNLNVASCSTNACNCNSTACVSMNPFLTGGVCSATPSTGALQCREGMVGALNSNGGSALYTAATAGNLASTPFPAGSMCYSYLYVGSGNSSGNNFTRYTGGNMTGCFLDFSNGQGLNSNFVSCATDNCGAPVPTGPQCPTANASVATSCYTGISGPTAAVAILGAVLQMSAPFTPANKAGGPTCLAATIPCSTLVAVSQGVVTATSCPPSQTLSLYSSAPAVAPGEDGGTCSDMLTSFSASLNSTAILGCGTNNCNAPASTVYVAASATLDGYTVATFGTAETAQFARAMASSLGVAASAVTVTGVSAAPAPAGRRLLSGVVVAFTVTTTVSSSATLTTALAAPLPASTFQSAGLTKVTTVAAAPAASTATAPTPIVAASLPQTGTGAAPSAAPVSARVSAAMALAVAALALAMSA